MRSTLRCTRRPHDGAPAGQREFPAAGIARVARSGRRRRISWRTHAIGRRCRRPRLGGCKRSLARDFRSRLRRVGLRPQSARAAGDPVPAPGCLSASLAGRGGARRARARRFRGRASGRSCGSVDPPARVARDPQRVTDDREPIPLSALQHWAYCPRQCGLIHLEQAFDDKRSRQKSSR